MDLNQTNYPKILQFSQSMYSESFNHSNVLNVLQTKKNLKLDDQDFEMQIRSCYSLGLMASSIATLLNEYKAKTGLQVLWNSSCE